MPSNDDRGPCELVYDERIDPLMTRIIAMCKEHGIPMLATFELDVDDEDGPMHCTTALADGACTPADDRINRACAVIMPQAPQWTAFVWPSPVPVSEQS